LGVGVEGRWWLVSYVPSCVFSSSKRLKFAPPSSKKKPGSKSHVADQLCTRKRPSRPRPIIRPPRSLRVPRTSGSRWLRVQLKPYGKAPGPTSSRAAVRASKFPRTNEAHRGGRQAGLTVPPLTAASIQLVDEGGVNQLHFSRPLFAAFCRLPFFECSGCSAHCVLFPLQRTSPPQSPPPRH